jgi:hypothetical protein
MFASTTTCPGSSVEEHHNMHRFPQLRTSLVAMLLLGAAMAPALAQDAGGVRLAPGLKGGPVGLARPLPFTRPPLLTAHDLQGGLTAADHQAQNQAMITRVRGDAGFLAGFAFGTPLAASRQPVQTWDGGDGRGHRRRQPIIINNNGPLAVTVGNDNLVQQQSAAGSGPIAQQQVANVGGHAASGGALNLVSGGGNIIQRAPN